MREGDNIRYVQFETIQGMGYGCFNMHWSREEGKITYRVGSAFCSPKDHFSKELARKIASGRALNNFHFGTIASEETGFITDEDFEKILTDMFSADPDRIDFGDFGVIPNWARKAFSRGKYFFSMRKTRISKGDLKGWRETFAAIKDDKDLKVIVHPAVPITKLS